MGNRISVKEAGRRGGQAVTQAKLKSCRKNLAQFWKDIRAGRRLHPSTIRRMKREDAEKKAMHDIKKAVKHLPKL